MNLKVVRSMSHSHRQLFVVLQCGTPMGPPPAPPLRSQLTIDMVCTCPIFLSFVNIGSSERFNLILMSLLADGYAIRFRYCCGNLMLLA